MTHLLLIVGLCSRFSLLTLVSYIIFTLLVESTTTLFFPTTFCKAKMKNTLVSENTGDYVFLHTSSGMKENALEL